MTNSMEQGISVSYLKPGTTLVVQTERSVYRLKILEGKEILLQGGILKDGSTRFAEDVKANFHGSTWGGSAIKVDWLGHQMHMEIGLGANKILTTTPIQDVEVIAPDGSWSYSMDWQKE